MADSGPSKAILDAIGTLSRNYLPYKKAALYWHKDSDETVIKNIVNALETINSEIEKSSDNCNYVYKVYEISYSPCYIKVAKTDKAGCRGTKVYGMRKRNVYKKISQENS